MAPRRPENQIMNFSVVLVCFWRYLSARKEQTTTLSARAKKRMSMTTTTASQLKYFSALVKGVYSLLTLKP